ncbi:hypothetical protein GCM10009127_15590 [Alteraurantiacibacter aestuarii]|uniref:Carboxypeptidase regulatory-like domain-containing protein n=1 Tax=Alteraurantiacibacter aestuarii TaxID=650004 RepID=A0A844ZJW3_9SPHN|nr:hypothetical protein [Alteraurantiacibacter aestuarii]
MRIAAFLLGVSSLCAASGAQAGDIAGTVYDARGEPAAAVQLEIAELGLTTVTGADGSYRFADVLAGEHRIAVLQGSQAIQRVLVNVDDGSDASRNIVMVSRRAVNGFLGSAFPAEAEDGTGEQAFSRALELADQMTREIPMGEAREWRWRDLDG